VENNLLKILRHSALTVPFYMSNISCDINNLSINEFPIVSKEMYQENIEKFISLEYKKEALMEFRTSGTTGQPMRVYKSKNDYIFQLRGLWKKRKSVYNITAKSKTISFEFTIDDSWLIDFSSDGKTLHINQYNLNKQTIHDVINCINSFKPEYIIAYPSQVNEWSLVR